MFFGPAHVGCEVAGTLPSQLGMLVGAAGRSFSFVVSLALIWLTEPHRSHGLFRVSTTSGQVDGAGMWFNMLWVAVALSLSNAVNSGLVAVQAWPATGAVGGLS